MIQAKNSITGNISVSGKLKGEANASIVREYPTLEDIEITPTLEDQVVKSDFYGINEVTVKGVTAEIDSDIKSENIKAGVNILGVDGGYEGIDTSDATALSEDILAGKTAYVNNQKIEGTMEEYDGSYEGNVSEEVKITDASYLFYSGARLNDIEKILPLCKNVVNTAYMFAYNQFGTFKTLDLNNLDMSNAINVGYMFNYCRYLTDLKSFKNLGKGYTQKSNNYSNYKLDLSSCTNLTYESLIDVLTNGLYDLNLTYDVVNGGTLYTQQLILGSTNLAKLTAEEIAIATNKGWTVS